MTSRYRAGADLERKARDADKAQHLVHLTEQLEQARAGVAELEAQVRQISAEIAT